MQLTPTFVRLLEASLDSQPSFIGLPIVFLLFIAIYSAGRFYLLYFKEASSNKIELEKLKVEQYKAKTERLKVMKRADN